MQIKKATVENFRCFKGENNITFSPGVNVIHAENGSGKSNLLYAMMWCLYGDAGLSGTPIENDSVHMIHNGQEEAKVEVVITLNSGDFLVSRTYKSQKEQTFKVYKIEKDGNHSPRPGGDIYVRDFLPRELIPFFFFDGEGADRIISQKTNLSYSMKKILGFDAMESVKDRLIKTRSAFVKKQNKGSNTKEQLEELSHKFDVKTKIVNDKKEKLEELETKVGELKTQRDEIEDKLRGYKETEQIQKNIDDIKEKIKKSRKDKEIYFNTYLKTFRKNISSILMEKITPDITYNRDEKTGEISAEKLLVEPWGPELIEKILSENKCICDRCVDKDSKEYKIIQNMLKTAVPQHQKDRDKMVSGMIAECENEKLNSQNDIIKDRQHYRDKISEIQKYEKHLEEAQKILEGVDVGYINDLKVAKNKLDDEISSLDRDIGKKINDLNIENQDLKEKEDELKKLTTNAASSDPSLAKKIELINHSIDWIDKINDEDFNNAHKKVKETVIEIIDNEFREDYIVNLNNEWHISFQDKEGNAIPKPSRGQSKLAGLAMSAAVVKVARGEEGEFNVVGGKKAPMVLDSIFGELDERNKDSALKFLLSMSEQTIFLVSSSQGGSELYESLESLKKSKSKEDKSVLKDRDVKHFYITAYRSSKQDNEVLEFAPKKELVIFNSKEEYSIINEV